MHTSAIICPQCRRVVALGAELPAICFGAIATEERTRLGGSQLANDPRAHHECVSLDVTVADELAPDHRLADVERAYEPQLTALAELAAAAKGG